MDTTEPGTGTEALDWSSVLFGDYPRFYDAYLGMSSEVREDVLAGAFDKRASSYSGLVHLTAVRDTDPVVFEAAARRALQANERNISALRAMAWHLERKKLFGEANDHLHRLVSIANTGDASRELLRNVFVAEALPRPQVEGSRIERARKNALSIASYRAQLQVSIGDDASAEVDDLDQELAARLASAIRDMTFNEAETTLSALAAVTPPLAKWGRARTVAVVGNGPNLRGAGLGSEIDSHDFVVRINYPATAGYEKDVGARTDLVLFYEGFRQKVVADLTLAATYRDVPGIGVATLERRVIDEAVETRPTLPWSLVSLLTDVTYERATTGFIAALLSSQVLRRPTSMYGFTFYQGGGDAYYFGPNNNVFIGHELDYEYWYCTKYLERVCPGRLSIKGLAR